MKQQYLPDELVGAKFYRPSENGDEKKVKEFMAYIKDYISGKRK